MATIKAYTDIEQSRKLAEILPLESADMCLTFVNNVWNPVWGKADDIYQLQKDCYEPDYTKDDYIDIDEFEPKVVPSWSLSALFDVLPKYIGDYSKCLYYDIGYYYCGYMVDGDFMLTIEETKADNPIDVCYEMVIRLHELNLL